MVKWKTVVGGEHVEIDLAALPPTPRVENFEDIPAALRERIKALCDKLPSHAIAELLNLPMEWIDRICREFQD